MMKSKDLEPGPSHSPCKAQPSMCSRRIGFTKVAVGKVVIKMACSQQNLSRRLKIFCMCFQIVKLINNNNNKKKTLGGSHFNVLSCQSIQNAWE